ncbi:MAG: SCP2 sterol-binding domain-containing protein [Candidatus Binatia bacterium]
METHDETETIEAPQPSTKERITEIFDAFRQTGAPGAETPSSYLFRLGGEQGGDYLLSVSPDGVSWAEESECEADVTIKMTAEDFVAMAEGRFDGRLAVASERIELEGNSDLAEAMSALFSREN